MKRIITPLLFLLLSANAFCQATHLVGIDFGRRKITGEYSEMGDYGGTDSYYRAAQSFNFLSIEYLFIPAYAKFGFRSTLGFHDVSLKQTDSRDTRVSELYGQPLWGYTDKAARGQSISFNNYFVLLSKENRIRFYSAFGILSESALHASYEEYTENYWTRRDTAHPGWVIQDSATYRLTAKGTTGFQRISTGGEVQIGFLANLNKNIYLEGHLGVGFFHGMRLGEITYGHFTFTGAAELSACYRLPSKGANKSKPDIPQ